MRKILLVLLLLLTGCASHPLYVDENNVSLYLADEPEVEPDFYHIEFRFQSPTDDPYLIQWIELGQWHGVEAFRVAPGFKSHVDSHFTGKGTREQHRKMTIAPGKVAGTDETFLGFSMLPSNWPPDFNSKYQAGHAIQGYVVYRKPEHETVYYLSFKDGVLTWWVDGTDIKREWRVGQK